jgi:hypothetical protein
MLVWLVWLVWLATAFAAAAAAAATVCDGLRLILCVEFEIECRHLAITITSANIVFSTAPATGSSTNTRTPPTIAHQTSRFIIIINISAVTE